LNLADVLCEPTFARSRRPRTVLLYRLALARLAKTGIVTAADAVDLRRLRAAYDARMETVTVKTARVEAIAVNAVMNHLAGDGRVTEDQLRAVRRLTPKPPPTAILCADFLTQEEVRDLAAQARETSSLVELTIWLGALSGLRAGEMARLRWTDVDLERRLIFVRGPVKTHKERAVPIVRELVPILQSHPGARLTRETGRGLVLGCGSSLSALVVSRRMRRLRKRTGQKITCLLLRHTRASWWLQANVPLVKVARWLGSGPDVIAAHYTGLLVGFDEDADRVAEAPRH
jgi:integrase